MLALEGISVAYRAGGSLLGRRRMVEAVRGVDLSIAAGETYALVGESGSGKSTIARMIAGLENPVAGSARFDGEDLALPVRRRSLALRRAVQIVFQNPDASLNPRHSVATILGRPLAVYDGRRGRRARELAAALLEAVELDPAFLDRWPGELSGGERQRVAIARALAAEPRLMLCDEVLSALDVSVQARIVALLQDLQAKRGLAFLFISHDLAVVRWLAHRVGVLYRGQLLEEGPVASLFEPPLHPYTEALLEAVPRFGDRVRPVGRSAGPGRAARASTGCLFASRCPRRIGPSCDAEAPPWRLVGPSHRIRCHLAPADLARARRPAPASAAHTETVP